MAPLPISPAPEELQVESLSVDAHGVLIHVRTKRRCVPCPVCGGAASRLHSRDRRTLADLPWHGIAVRPRVQTRRFSCDVPECERRIFAERLARTTAAHARRTNRLGSALDLLALQMLASPDTLLRRLRTRPDPAREPARILGVDDRAWRKGHTYGTILADLERGRVVELTPGT